MPRKASSEFGVGAKIVYPSHGIGVIDKIDQRKMLGSDEPCYVIRFDGGMTIMAPVRSAQNVGIRNVIKRREVPRVLGILKGEAAAAQGIESNWNKRQKLYQEKLKSGSIFEVAAVYRDLSRLRNRKGLSFGEQQVYDNAHRLIVSELAEAKGVGEAKVVELINEALTC